MSSTEYSKLSDGKENVSVDVHIDNVHKLSMQFLSAETHRDNFGLYVILFMLFLIFLNIAIAICEIILPYYHRESCVDVFINPDTLLVIDGISFFMVKMIQNNEMIQQKYIDVLEHEYNIAWTLTSSIIFYGYCNVTKITVVSILMIIVLIFKYMIVFCNILKCIMKLSVIVQFFNQNQIQCNVNIMRFAIVLFHIVLCYCEFFSIKNDAPTMMSLLIIDGIVNLIVCVMFISENIHSEINVIFKFIFRGYNLIWSILGSIVFFSNDPTTISFLNITIYCVLITRYILNCINIFTSLVLLYDKCKSRS